MRGPRPSYHDNRRGVVAIVSACAMFTINDLLAKLTTLVYPSSEVLFVRGVGTMILIFAALAYKKQTTSWLADAARSMVILRALFEASAHVIFILALARMRLAELVAVNLVSPLLLTMLFAVFFKEPIGWRRWCAIFLGLAGVLFIVKPSPSGINLWALFALVGAFMSTFREIATRQIHSGVSTLAISFVSMIAVTLAGAIIAWGAGDMWSMLPFKYLSFVIISAIALSIGSYFSVAAFRNVDITIVAPFRYMLLIWGGLGAYIIFGEVPDVWAFVGGAMIAGSGLYVLHRERIRHRELSATAAIH